MQFNDETFSKRIAFEILKHNCGPRKECSIESVLLEQILMLNLAKRTVDLFAQTVSDLEASCDSQLPKIGGIFKEYIAANR